MARHWGGVQVRVLQGILYLVLATTPAFGQLWSGILSPTRATDWSTAGIPGGIPSVNWTQAGSTITAAQSPCLSGAGDCTATIQAVLNACGTNHVIVLGAGTFLIDGTLVIPPHCALRGQGPSQTILNAMGTVQNAVIAMGAGTTNPQIINTPTWTSAVSITGGTAQGSASITLSSAAGITVGSYLVIDQLNDGVTVTISGNNGPCTWCDAGEASGNRSQGQIVKVTSVSGTTVGISPGLFVAYTLTPWATPVTLAASSGVEELQIYANNTGYSAAVYMAQCAYCWVSAIEDNYADGDHVDVDFSYHGEIVNSYFSNAYIHEPGLFDSDVSLRTKSVGMLIQNNILDRLHSDVMLEWGAAGNVVAYNYANGDFDTSAPNVVDLGLDYHGAHPQFNLYEGNIVANMGEDSIHGSEANDTYFRNWARGANIVCNPLSGRATVVCAPFGIYGTTGVNSWATTQAERAVDIQYQSSNVNLVGNVVASKLMENLTTLYGTHTPIPLVNMVDAPTYRDYQDVAYGYSFGYYAANDDGLLSMTESQTPYTTLFWHGDYSDISQAVVWASGVTHTLPPSFYLAARPSWWTPTLPWPAIGPDVASGAGAGGHAGLIPAENCYQNVMGGSDGAPGSPYVFNPDQCYGTAPATRISGLAFSGLTVQ